jgi:hypothetical protein
MRKKPKFSYLLGAHLIGSQKMAVLILWSACLSGYAQDTNQAQVVSGPGFQIVAQTVEKTSTLNGRPLYTLSYRF